MPNKTHHAAVARLPRAYGLSERRWGLKIEIEDLKANSVLKMSLMRTAKTNELIMWVLKDWPKDHSSYNLFTVPPRPINPSVYVVSSLSVRLSSFIAAPAAKHCYEVLEDMDEIYHILQEIDSDFQANARDGLAGLTSYSDHSIS
ncbi:hypothetical protein H109_04212 [Trichophyton interdigitale MR816]|uniref:Uncharacterized protein n=1 Tax=Trichophyton interdigitale (strain MR816) TaxID=1215338 RepID=A0A059J8T3_TRIIM|nr:hypothetical protein H109_04212 [Trichophyton interdigitale MR816]